MVELSEKLNLRLDVISGDTRHEKQALGPDQVTNAEAAISDDAESQMRKALGLLGDAPRQRQEAERMDMPARAVGERFSGGLHRRRFVQDGDVPVTVLRREPGAEQPQHRGAAPAAAQPTSSRLQRTEAALAAETAARDKADRALAETQALVRDLQTKIGHAELAKNEAVEALRQEREQNASLREEAESWEERLQEAEDRAEEAEHVAQTWQEQLHEERNARKAAEKALRQSEAAREAAEALVRSLSSEAPASRRTKAVEPEPVAAAPAPRRPKVVESASAEPEPVKWWLTTATTKPAGKKR